ncbi:bifunctional DNA primase/polymerase [Granulicoccus sp. GXG6511]|uniref:bifunctional DNA primase/polymerase n=1 Tax=Granulicoccus sp. GXG6511 TaxID=3381351 RepID=UPI003D7E14FD
MIDEVLRLVGAGFPVLPCRWEGPDAKAPLISNGFHNATTDPEKLRKWWGTWPDAMIGVAIPEGIVVFDIDPRNRGSREALEAVVGPLPPTQTTISGRGDGGEHLWFRVPPGTRLQRHDLPAGVDLKEGTRGYVIVAPSLHPDTGEPYRWEGPEEIAELPPRAVDVLTRGVAQAVLKAQSGPVRPVGEGVHPYARRAIEEELGRLSGAVRGNRDVTCFEVACNLNEFANSGWAGYNVDQAERDFLEHAPVEEDFPGAQAKKCWSQAQAQVGDTARKEPGTWTPPTPMTLADAHMTFRRWFGDGFDLDVIDAVLATAAAQHLDGEPAWLLVLSGSGNAKTEVVQTLVGAGATIVSSIASEGALLSGTSRKERAADATGGLLRKIGSGTLVIKDVTTILSMARESRTQVLAALREIYDGRWSRNMAVDGGQTLEWKGRITIIGAVTSVWDTHHSVIAAMGDRFVVIRSDSTVNRIEAARQAILNTGSEQQMRQELSLVSGGVIAGRGSPADLTDDIEDRLMAAADLVTRARTAVERDYQGNVVDAQAPEMPTRFVKQLTQLFRGGTAIGLTRGEAMRLAIRCARDSVPPLRLAIIDDLASHPQSSTTEVRKRLGKPHNTIDRELQALQMLGILDCDEVAPTTGQGRRLWRFSLADDIEPDAIKPVSRKVSTPPPEEKVQSEALRARRFVSRKVSNPPPPLKRGEDRVLTFSSDKPGNRVVTPTTTTGGSG